MITTFQSLSKEYKEEVTEAYEKWLDLKATDIVDPRYIPEKDDIVSPSVICQLFTYKFDTKPKAKKVILMGSITEEGSITTPEVVIPVVKVIQVGHNFEDVPFTCAQNDHLILPAKYGETMVNENWKTWREAQDERPQPKYTPEPPRIVGEIQFLRRNRINLNPLEESENIYCLPISTFFTKQKTI